MRKKEMRKRIISILLIALLTTTGCGAKTPQPDFDAAAGLPALSSQEPVAEEPGASSLESSAAGPGQSSLEPATKDPTAGEPGTSYPDPVGPGIQDPAAGEPGTSSPDPVAPASPQVTLLMVGDILLHVPVEKSAKREDGSYSYDAIFEHTKDLISEADLALVNQEVILGGTELGISGYPAFNAPYEVGDDLAEAGFDVICHATNHALDKGKAGVVNCLRYWESAHQEIQVLGIHDAPDDPLFIYEKDGMKIAFLNYTYGTNGIALPQDMPYAVDLLSKEKVIADIQYAESVADFTVVCPHWGTEYRLTADASQAKWTKLFFENGVDLVLGTHPHVIEPVEMITDEESGHSMLVYYSLGNFVNWTSSSGSGIANRMVGGMAGVTLKRGDDGNVFIADYDVTALVCHLTPGQDGVTTWPLASYSEELAAENSICSQDPAFSYVYCTNLCNEVWGDLWK